MRYGTPKNIKARIWVSESRANYPDHTTMTVRRRHKRTVWTWGKLTPASRGRWSRLMDVAERAGVRSSFVWLYFKSKEEEENEQPA